jgi:hypothetical protein
MRIIKLIGAVIFGVIIAALIGFGSANYAGVCISKGSYLSDAELIKRAASREFQSHLAHIRYYESTGGDDKGLIRYGNFEDFIARNPNCCMVTRVAREGYEVELIDRLLGWFRSFVRIYYAYETNPNDVSHPKMKEVFWAVTNCGYVWNGV